MPKWSVGKEMGQSLANLGLFIVTWPLPASIVWKINLLHLLVIYLIVSPHLTIICCFPFYYAIKCMLPLHPFIPLMCKKCRYFYQLNLPDRLLTWQVFFTRRHVQICSWKRMGICMPKYFLYFKHSPAAAMLAKQNKIPTGAGIWRHLTSNSDVCIKHLIYLNCYL